MANNRRISAMFLALVLFVMLFAGCGNPTNTDATTPAPQTTTAPPASAGTTVETTTAAPFRTFGGRKFVISSTKMAMLKSDPNESAMAAGKMAVYSQLEDDLDIVIEFIDESRDLSVVLGKLMSGIVPADIAHTKFHSWMPLALKGLILPFDDPDIVAGGLDYTNPDAFFQPFTSVQKYNGKVYGVVWAGKYFIPEFGWCIYFNKQLIADAGVPDLYQVVREGNWDWTFFRDLAIKTTQDLDGDGQIDIYGVGTFGYGEEIFTKPGAEIVREENGVMKVVLDEPAALEALEFTRQFAFLDKVRHPDPYGDVHRRFTEGKVAMVWGEQKNTSGALGFQETLIDYGLVPMPKAPGADHYVNVLGGVYSTGIYAANENVPDVAYILNQIGLRFTDEEWHQMYLENDLRGDTDALDMVLNYIWPNTVVDYVWSSEPLVDFFRNNIYLPMTEGLGTPVQLVEQFKAQMQAEVDALFRQD